MQTKKAPERRNRSERFGEILGILEAQLEEIVGVGVGV